LYSTVSSTVQSVGCCFWKNKNNCMQIRLPVVLYSIQVSFKKGSIVYGLCV